MIRTTLMAVSLSLSWMAMTAPPGRAQTCAGDCNDGGTVVISELISCVNIALGNNPVATCQPCDVNADGSVAINELVQAVNAASNGCVAGPTPTPVSTVICGNHVTEGDEDCDDGNTVGGDGCAANCTTETRRATTLDSTHSKATVQLGPIPITLTLKGTQALIAGRPRNVETIGPNNEHLFAAGEFPLVVRASDVKFDPVSIPGNACACVRAVPVAEFGEGISGVGKVGCNPDGLTDINFRVSQDHDTTPGRPGNGGSGMGLPDDPECDDMIDAGGGVKSTACLEGTGAACSKPESEHIGACNSPRAYRFSGGSAGRGSVLLYNSSAIGLLEDLGACAEKHLPNGQCAYAQYGPDCKPCTDDDTEKGTANVSPTTSGTAEVEIFDFGDDGGAYVGPGATCGPLTCVASVTGAPTDCDAIMQNPNAPLTGALVTAFPSLDGKGVGDSLITTTLAAQP